MFLQKLIKSSQFWLAILDIVQIVVLTYLAVPQEIWQAINGLLLVIIGAITADQVTASLGRTLRETIVELRKLNK